MKGETQMAISKAEIKKFAKLLAEEFLDGRGTSDLQGSTQDHIDSFVIPLMAEVECIINDLIAEKIRASFDHDPLDEDDDWWTNGR